jgi:coenzyme Q-binding protein COQ10
VAKVETTEVFQTPIENIYKVITDYNSYPDFVDGVSSVNILEQDDNGARVEYSLNLIKKFTYIIKLTHSGQNHIVWELESGDIFKKNTGSWKLTDLGNGETEVVYQLDIEFKGFAPKAVVNKLVSGNLPKMMGQYHERAKNL